MGYDFTFGATKRDIIKQCTQDWESDTHKATRLAHCVRGNILWAVFTHLDKVTGESQTIIHCDLLQNGRGYGWGYKGMTERCGPHWTSCPLAYLDMAEETNPEWRQGVREFHAKAARKFQVGDVVALVGCKIPHVTITSTRPMRGVYNGKLYSLPKQLLGEVIS